MSGLLSDLSVIDFQNFENNTFNVVTELKYEKNGEHNDEDTNQQWQHNNNHNIRATTTKTMNEQSITDATR